MDYGGQWRKTSKKATAVVEARDDGGWDQGGDRGDGEEQTAERVLETILEAEPTGLESDWMLGCGRNQGGVTGAREGLE